MARLILSIGSLQLILLEYGLCCRVLDLLGTSFVDLGLSCGVLVILVVARVAEIRVEEMAFAFD